MELKSLQGQVLLHLIDGEIRNVQGQAIGKTSGTKLVSIDGQVLAEVENGCVFRHERAALLRVEDMRVVNSTGQQVATVGEGSQDDQALLAAAFLVFLQ